MPKARMRNSPPTLHKRYRSRGRWYAYHRKSGMRLHADFGSPAFWRELAAAEEAHLEETRAGLKPGTLGMAIARYRESPAFARLAARTRSDYEGVFRYLARLAVKDDKITDWPLVEITPPAIARLRDLVFARRKRRFANYVLSVLSVVFAHGREYGLMADNPARGIKPVPRALGLPKANRPWTADERAAVLEAAPGYLRVAIALGMFTGMREGDVIRLPRNARTGDGWLKWTSGKAGVEAEWPLHSGLAEVLDANPSDAVTMCVSSKRRPWRSENAFRSAFFTLVRRLEAEGRIGGGLTFHGLRHSVGALLKEDGASDEDIAIALGQKTLAMARHYSEGASKRRRMSAMVTAFHPLRGRPGDPRQLRLDLDDGK